MILVSRLFWLHVAVVLALPGSIAVGWQSLDERVGQWVPDEVAVVASLQHPGKLLGSWRAAAGLDDQEGAELLRDLLMLVTQGEEERASGLGKLLAALADAEAVHLFLTDSREQLGSPGIVVELRQDPAAGLNLEGLEELTGFFCQVARQLLEDETRMGGEVDRALQLLHSGVNTGSTGRYLIATGSGSLTAQIVEALETADGRQDATASRAWRLAREATLSGASVRVFLAPSRLRHVGPWFLGVSAQVWDEEATEELSWVRFSLRTENDSDGILVERMLACGSTEPFRGNQESWSFFRPFEEYPPLLPESWERVSGESMLWKEWISHRRSRKTGLAANGVSDGRAEGTPGPPLQEQDPVAEFLAGDSRPELGGHSLHLETGPERGVSFLHFAKTDRDAAARCLARYFDDLDQSYQKAGFRTSRTALKSRPMVLSVDSPTAVPALPSADQPLFGSASSFLRALDQPRRPAWADKAAGIDGQWVVLGDEQSLGLLWDGEGRSSNILQGELEKVRAAFNVRSFHRFEVLAGPELARRAAIQLSRLLNRFCGQGWHLSDRSFEKLLANEHLTEWLTRAQTAGFVLRKFTDRIRKTPGVVDIAIWELEGNRLIMYGRTVIPDQPADSGEKE